MIASIKRAEEYRNTCFLSQSQMGWTAVWQGQVLGRVKPAHKERLAAKALAFMAFNGVKYRRLVQVDENGRRTLEVS